MWSLDGTRARVTDSPWSLEIDAARPPQGLILARRPSLAEREGGSPGATTASTRLLGLEPCAGEAIAPLSECYLRQNDLVADYPQDESSSYSLQLQWRLVACDAHHSVLQLTVAVQTSRLDCHPMIDLVCDSLAGAAAAVEIAPQRSPALPAKAIGPPPVVRFPLTGGGTSAECMAERNSAASQPRRDFGGSAALMVAPADVPMTGQRSEADQLRYRLFEEFLEKGVIRKARVWLVVWDGEPSDTAIARIYAALASAPLPLTS
jgi:hypothetical protein